MSDIWSLEQQKREMEAQIASHSAQIKRLSANHDSLLQFKGVVSRSKGDFDKLNSDSNSVLEPLDSIASSSKIAEKYKKGMQHSLSNIGMKIVGGAYSGLSYSIDLKLKSYKGQIDRLERDIVFLNNSITTVDNDIETMKREEENT